MATQSTLTATTVRPSTRPTMTYSTQGTAPRLCQALRSTSGAGGSAQPRPRGRFLRHRPRPSCGAGGCPAGPAPARPVGRHPDARRPVGGDDDAPPPLDRWGRRAHGPRPQPRGGGPGPTTARASWHRPTAREPGWCPPTGAEWVIRGSPRRGRGALSPRKSRHSILGEPSTGSGTPPRPAQSRMESDRFRPHNR